MYPILHTYSVCEHDLIRYLSSKYARLSNIIIVFRAISKLHCTFCEVSGVIGL